MKNLKQNASKPNPPTYKNGTKWDFSQKFKVGLTFKYIISCNTPYQSRTKQNDHLKRYGKGI